MKLQVYGYPPIEISPALCKPEKGAFTAETPYINKLVSRLSKPSYRLKKLPSKLGCLQSLKHRAEALGGYESFSEPLAGVGLSARVFERPSLWLNDFDPECREILKHNFPRAEIHGEDIGQLQFPKSDMTFLDFNDFTLKRFQAGAYRELLARGLEASAKFLVLNNCTIFYFRYGKQSFENYSQLLGKPVTSIPEYLRVEAAYFHREFPNWYVVQVTYFRDSAFMLFARKKASLGIEEVPKLLPVAILTPLMS